MDKEKVKAAIDRIQGFADIAAKHHDDEGNAGYYLAFSGGKDSVAVKRLMDMAGVPYQAFYRVTSVDPPELVRFIKDKHPNVKFDIPRDGNGKRITMWNLIPKHTMPPIRTVRYCCADLKESGGDGRFTVTGVRWAESLNRQKLHGAIDIRTKSLDDDPNFSSNGKGGAVLVNDNSESRQMVDACVTRHKTCLNPIIDWTDSEVWGFIRSEKIPYCSLYDEGYGRLGCIGCPMGGRKQQLKQFAKWPKYKDGYINAFDKMLKARYEAGCDTDKWHTAEEVFNWWLDDPNIKGQMKLWGDGNAYT